MKIKKMLVGSLAAVVVSMGAVAPVAASAAPAPAPAVVAAPAPADGTSEATTLKNAAVGTTVWVKNKTGQKVTVGDQVLEPGGTSMQTGRNATVDDVSTTIRVGDNYSIPLYGHNPPFSEAYVQLGGQKFFDTGKFRHGDFTYEVEFRGTHKSSQSTFYYKIWDVTITDAKPAWDREFIHHTDRDDGVKGYVRNQTDQPLVWQSNGHQIQLRPGGSLLLFDSDRVGPDADYFGAAFTMYTGGGTVQVKAVDPAVTTTKVSVVGHSPFTSFKEGDAHTYQLADGYKLTVQRATDGRLPVPFENWHTQDWASYEFTVTR